MSRGTWRNIASPSDAPLCPESAAPGRLSSSAFGDMDRRHQDSGSSPSSPTPVAASRPWRVIAILWRAGAGPIVQPELNDRHPPVRGWDRSPRRRYPNAPCRLWSDLIRLDPGMAAAVPVVRRGPSPFPRAERRCCTPNLTGPSTPRGAAAAAGPSEAPSRGKAAFPLVRRHFGRNWGPKLAPSKRRLGVAICPRMFAKCDSAVLPLLVSQLSSYNPTRIRAPERLAMRSWRIPSLLRCFFGLSVLFALTMGTILTASTSSRADVEPKRVLMLHSFGLRFKPWTDYAQFIRAGITRGSQTPVDFHDHSLLNARLADDKADGPFVDYLHALYADKPPDLIVAIGAPAANFVQRYRERIFPGTPDALHGRRGTPGSIRQADP